MSPTPPGAAAQESVPLRTRMHADLTAAMKAGDRIAVRVLRTALAALANAEALPIADGDGAPVMGRLVEHRRRTLTAHDAARVLQAEVDDRIDTVAQFERVGRHDAAVELRTEIAVLNPYVAESWVASGRAGPTEIAGTALSAIAVRGQEEDWSDGDPRDAADHAGSSGGSPSSVSKPGSG